jgi:hypothetical protein
MMANARPTFEPGVFLCRSATIFTVHSWC